MGRIVSEIGTGHLRYGACQVKLFNALTCSNLVELRGFEPLTYSMRTRVPGRLAAQVAGNSVAGSLRAGAGTTGSQQTFAGPVHPRPPAPGAARVRFLLAALVGPEHYREGWDW
jgi:hypothetical protein